MTVITFVEINFQPHATEQGVRAATFPSRLLLCSAGKHIPHRLDVPLIPAAPAGLDHRLRELALLQLSVPFSQMYCSTKKVVRDGAGISFL